METVQEYFKKRRWKQKKEQNDPNGIENPFCEKILPAGFC
jgi:hypothetical protein